MHLIKRYYPFIFIILLSFSCKKKVKLSFEETPIVVGEKEIVDVVSPADSVAPDFRFLKAKLRATVQHSGGVQTFNGNMRWEKGEKIWMSMSLFGIEGVRAWIDSSGVQWIDRINGEHHFLPMDKLASKINMNLDFAAIERLFLGLPAMKDTLPTEVTTSDQWIKWVTNHKNGFRSTAIFNRINNMLVEYNTNNAIENRHLSAKYSDARAVGNGWFPFERMVTIDENSSNFKMQMKFSEVVISEELSFPFEITNKYKKVEY
ncbi:MAG TPA: DUF4292 domain-containing protein [Chitinophagales bacterium]|nr:DUF4292 domain-containing protein [Chitinophagales bacterium]